MIVEALGDRVGEDRTALGHASWLLVRALTAAAVSPSGSPRTGSSSFDAVSAARDVQTSHTSCRESIAAATASGHRNESSGLALETRAAIAPSSRRQRAARRSGPTPLISALAVGGAVRMCLSDTHIGFAHPRFAHPRFAHPRSALRAPDGARRRQVRMALTRPRRRAAPRSGREDSSSLQAGAGRRAPACFPIVTDLGVFHSWA